MTLAATAAPAVHRFPRAGAAVYQRGRVVASAIILLRDRTRWELVLPRAAWEAIITEWTRWVPDTVIPHCPLEASTACALGTFLLMGKCLRDRGETSWCDTIAQACPEFWPTVDLLGRFLAKSGGVETFVAGRPDTRAFTPFSDN
jgi:hypothetical protein